MLGLVAMLLYHPNLLAAFLGREKTRLATHSSIFITLDIRLVQKYFATNALA